MSFLRACSVEFSCYGFSIDQFTVFFGGSSEGLDSEFFIPT